MNAIKDLGDKNFPIYMLSKIGEIHVPNSFLKSCAL